MLRSTILLALVAAAALALPVQQAAQSVFVCPLCQGFVHQYEQKYFDRIDEFKATLDDKCLAFWGPTFAQICVNAFNNKMDEVKEQLEKKYSPLNVCQALALCK
ncbi:hypothetical protein PENTCL1PPCAC_5456 [Pristionchus entomophagus]|uniref:Saposin B-type domain-containing protein n=1 Tax=Pristionchus entomophagus TaxID=358040 RepID=A0AAV5SJ32_9BILA|nr:hypothetical protein PENTCL1PPCAC_5456 [Pristionchus entomophagus]